MELRTDAVGKTYPPAVYAVGREKIKEYARAVGETDSVHLDHETARGRGFRDVIAPPMFCVVYKAPALATAILDPEVAIDFARMVHGGQEFRWGPLVQAGDEIETVVEVEAIEERDGRGFYVFQSRSVNQDGQTVCVGTWTNIVRGG